jgi:hypothetical protein
MNFLLLLLHGLAVVALLFLAVPIVIKFILFFFIILSALFHLLHKKQITCSSQGQDHWVITEKGLTHRVILVNAFVSGALIILYFKTNKRHRVLLLAKDSLEEVVFRQLQARLRAGH